MTVSVATVSPSSTGISSLTSESLQSFSSLLSSIGDKPQAPASAPKPNANSTPANAPPGQTPNGASSSDRFKLTPNNAAAGVKRRSEEPEAAQKQKQVRTEQNGRPNRPAPTAPANRFQLSAKSATAQKPSSPAVQRSPAINASSTNAQKAAQKQLPKPAAPTPAASAASSSKPKGFAAMLAKAAEAQAAAKSQATGGIQHKPAEKLSRRERERLQEKLRAKEQAAKKNQPPQDDRSRSGTPMNKPGVPKKPELSYKGTMKKPAEKEKPERQPLSYRGTMRPAGSQPKPPPKKGEAQDKYGGYASWSDLDDAEDEEEGYYDEDSEDDMEGGFEEMEQEESRALKAARKEDQEALEEEERLKNEKLERKKKLMALSKNAAGKKRF
ncbi:hypothetical protein D0863_05866 [Hortaea werneckii]|uniref:SPT2 chromatin protein n=1 Tax=Hortaea werneckii TaxID=91943 RepID=A0A3M7E1Q8_HORWE|nr:hypothetical protein D0863_05866 [Hortaea werneckii]